ncbi:MAG: hypothetical protein MRZ79_14725 [Bacteroidia bacterium]|nr:hypothetical protein [Bacteroidia bacterium]
MKFILPNIKIMLFVTLLLGAKSIFSQDNADPKLIEHIRKHYYAIAHTPGDYQVRNFGQTKVWYRHNEIQEIVFYHDGARIEATFEGHPHKLNFAYIKKGEQEDRFYFKHMKHDLMFPELIRWLGKGKVYHDPESEAYFEKNKEVASLILSAFNEIWISEQRKRSSYPKYNRYIKQIDQYVDSLTRQKLEEEIIYLEDFSASEEEGGDAVSSDKSSEFKGANGEILIQKSSHMADEGGAFVEEHQYESYLKNGKVVKSVSRSISYNMGISVMNYSDISFQVHRETIKYYQNGRFIYGEDRAGLQNYPMYLMILKKN